MRRIGARVGSLSLRTILAIFVLFCALAITPQTLAEEGQADLSILKFGPPNPVTVGHNLTYSLHVSNAGPDAASNVVVTDHLPNGLTYVDAESSPTCDETSQGVVTCTLGILGAGTDVQFVIVVTTSATGTYDNTASVTSDTPDSDSEDNSATAQTRVRLAPVDLGITMSDAQDPIELGQDVIYSLTVTNDGPGEGSFTGVTPSLSGTLAYNDSASSPECGPVSQTGPLFCRGPGVPPGGSLTFTIVAKATQLGTITSSARPNTDRDDINSVNDRDSEQTTVLEPGSLPFESFLVASPMVIDDRPDPITLRLGTVSARLTGPDALPVPGKLIIFSTANADICGAITQADGVATCALPLDVNLAAILELGYTARFEGDAVHKPSTDQGKIARIAGLELL